MNALAHLRFEPSPAPRAFDALVRAVFAPRPRDSHKGTFGRAALLCGSPAYPGAALLAAEGALRAGAGLTELHTPAVAAEAARVRLPELLVRELPPVTEDPGAADALFARQDVTALLVGCGLGRGTAEYGLRASLLAAMAAPGGPLILDADALNILAADRPAFSAGCRAAARPVVLTPHPLEFSRLSGLPVETIQAARRACAAAFAQENRVVLLLKGAGTVLAAPDGRVAVLPAGSPALAKGGSGDVLAGFLAGLCAMGVPTYEAACAAAYLHGRAGEHLAARYTECGVLPSALPAAMAKVAASRG